jgi:GT2 family glycosyltransferase
MKISVVIQYYNRKSLLLNTLRSIQHSQVKNDLELIIIDDASETEHQLTDIQGLFPDLNIKLFEFKTEEKWWACPVLPINKGISMATGDIIMFLCAECMFIGDVLLDLSQRIKPNDYIVYGAFAIEQADTDNISSMDYNELVANRFKGKWYHHSLYRNTYYNFCSAILRDDLNELGGFDERYAHGIAHGDDDFLLRIRRKEMNIISVEHVYVYHQWHPPMLVYPQTGQMADAELYRHVLHNEPNNYKVKNSFI